jgi:hypothetical protein
MWQGGSIGRACLDINFLNILKPNNLFLIYIYYLKSIYLLQDIFTSPPPFKYGVPFIVQAMGIIKWDPLTTPLSNKSYALKALALFNLKRTPQKWAGGVYVLEWPEFS